VGRERDALGRRRVLLGIQNRLFAELFVTKAAVNVIGGEVCCCPLHHAMVYQQHSAGVFLNGSHIMRYDHDGAILVYGCEQFVHLSLQDLVNVGIRFVEDDGVGS